MFNIKPGDIIIVNNWKGSFLSGAIRFFTKSWSHTAIGFFDLPHNPLPAQTIFEANLTTGLTDWEQTYDNFESYDLKVYRWTSGSKALEQILWSLWERYNGNAYGFMQLIWFVWRWIVEKLHLPKRWARKNFFPNKEICTEVVYVAFKEMNDPVVNSVLAKLNRDQNTVHPGDIMWICDELCKMGHMELVYVRQRGS